VDVFWFMKSKWVLIPICNLQFTIYSRQSLITNAKISWPHNPTISQFTISQFLNFKILQSYRLYLYFSLCLDIGYLQFLSNSKDWYNFGIPYEIFWTLKFHYIFNLYYNIFYQKIMIFEFKCIIARNTGLIFHYNENGSFVIFYNFWSINPWTSNFY